jgi:ribosomal protein S18 acetylase RimI-like enzyme
MTTVAAPPGVRVVSGALTPEHEAALVRLATLSSAVFDNFVFRSTMASQQFNEQLYRRGGSCFAPPAGHLLLVDGEPAGMMAVAPPVLLNARRAAWASALPRDRMRSDPRLRVRFRLATRALLQLHETDAYLTRIAVDPEFTGRGYGTLLLSLALDETRRLGLRRCVLEVAESNERAISLYERAGFRSLAHASATDPETGERMGMVHMGKAVANSE